MLREIYFYGMLKDYCLVKYQNNDISRLPVISLYLRFPEKCYVTRYILTFSNLENLI